MMYKHFVLLKTVLLVLELSNVVYGITTSKQSDDGENKETAAVETLPTPSSLKSDNNFTDFVQYHAVADQLTRNFFDQQRGLSPVQQSQILDDIQQSVQRFQYHKTPSDENFFQRQKERALQGFPKLNSDLTPPKPDFGTHFPISSNSILSSNYPTLTPPPPPRPPQKASTFREQSNYIAPFVKQPENQNYIPLSQSEQNTRDFRYTSQPETPTNFNPYLTTNNNFQKTNSFHPGSTLVTNFYQQSSTGNQFQSNSDTYQQNKQTNSVLQNSPNYSNSPNNGNIQYGNSFSTNGNQQFQTSSLSNANYPNTQINQNYQTQTNNFQSQIKNYQPKQTNNYQNPINQYQTFGNVYPSPNKNSFQPSKTTTTFQPPVRDTFSPDDAVKTLSPLQYLPTKQVVKSSSTSEYSPSPTKSFDYNFDFSKIATQTTNLKPVAANYEISASTPKSYENFELKGSTTSSPKASIFFQKVTSQPQKNQNTKNSKIEIIKDSDVELDTTLLEKQIRQQLLSLNDQGESFPPTSFTFNPGNLSSLPSFTFDDGNTIAVPSEDKVEGSKQIKTIVIRQPTTTTTTTTTTIKPPSKILEEVTKNIIPSGAKIEILRTNQDGTNLEIDKSNLPSNLENQKKVTFVILEEQPDGSVKVQGVKSNNEQSQNSDVDSILKKIKDGEIKLPQSSLPGRPKHLADIFNQTPKSTAKPTTYVEYKTYSSQKPIYSSPLPSFTPSSQTSFAPSSQPSTILDFVSKPNSHFIPTPLESPSSDDLKTLYNDVTKDYFNDYSTKDTREQSSSYFAPTPQKKTKGEEEDSNIYENNFVPTTTAGESNYYGSGKHKYYQYSSPTIPSSTNPTQQTVEPSPTYNKNRGEESHLLTYNIPSTKYSSHKTYQTTSHSTPQTTTYRPPSISTTLITRSTAFTPFLPTVSNSEDFYSFTEIPSTHAPATRIRYIQSTPQSTQNVETEESQTNLSSTSFSSDWTLKSSSPSAKSLPPITRHTKYHPEDFEEDSESAGSRSNVGGSDENLGEERLAQSKSGNSLNDVLKRNGLFAMAKFLRQSGLDQILNETGPYTIFVPTDKAFKALLVQLGGPDKAEEKFKENPRLLSGLLLHHVIPGAFQLSSLQDEMTGVSLAGTQLRVNTFTVQDIEWNDIQVLTINGAKVVEDKKDITIPQGVAHAVDRVMFPLPVGDLLQTLQSDRDGRFSHFLKVLQHSGLVSIFTGIKTYTVFAPINKGLPESQMSDLLADSLTAKKFILKHIIPGALYSAGMRYYQVKESMDIGQKLKVYKESGRVKVNSAQVITRNIPATNGVIHAIEVAL